MNYRKTIMAMTSAALLLGIGYGASGQAFADPSRLQSAAALPAIQADTKYMAQVSQEEAKAKAEQELKKFKSLLDQQKKALSGTYLPGEIRYVYINDKEYQASSIGSSYASNSYSLMFRNYDEYVKKYAAGKTAMRLELNQLPDGYNFTLARIAPYQTSSEQKQMFNQVIAEGKASGKKIYVKKLQEKRTSIELIYTMAAPVNGITGVLSINAEPAGAAGKAVESEPVQPQSEKLKVGGQEVIYTANDKQEHKSVVWMNAKTHVNYIIREDRGHLNKEELLALAGQVMEASK
ncbi:hypothetical protein QW71_33050 [Paenibacillus sp. IHB B 3415]|uniref:hypothetical protein n=1 Tax=Paenibacillus sp. IHB B 3415 TaxID=867080 RepID=UPI0005742252|nr:hypothetical protein [Paenibacillus sp. IHB B 3415]KHL91738.1 hypothetical protein QW71_33050 [Paenibacillus sp. IHB B 3415]